MKKQLFLLTIIIFLFSCQKSTDIKAFNKELIKIVKENSFYSYSINWISVERELDSISKIKQNIDKCSTSVTYILNNLRAVGDNHSVYVSKTFMLNLTKKSLCGIQPEGKYLGDKIAYVKVPEFASINDSVFTDFASKIQILIKNLDTNSIKGWIVDLRGNTGGNMYPMIAGLGPLTGEGILGYFIDRTGQKTPWSYQNGNILNNKKIVVHIPNPYTIKNKNAKIAVLINSQTSSSGEMTCISFIGKANTKLFGQASGGYTTANGGFMLPDSSFICLATSITADRNMRKYNWKIIPDVLIYNNMYNDDRCLNEAVNWLKEK